MPEHLPYLVEPMTLTDIAHVMEIERVAFPAPWSARAYRYEITENEHSTMLVVRPATVPNGPFTRITRQWLARHSLKRHLGVVKPGPVLGYAGFWLLVDQAHICTIAVHPHWRGRGLGSLLLLSMIEQATELGAYRATLEVRASNRVAQQLYLKHGFEIVSRRKRYYADNNEDACIMATPPFETPTFQMNLNRCRSQLHARLQAERPDLPTQDHSTDMSAQNQRTG